MKCLLLVSFNPKNTDQMQAYAAAAAPTLADYDAEIVVKGESTDLAGNSPFKMRTVIAFDSREKAEAWYESDAYQKAIPIREQAMEAEFTLVG